MIDELDVQPKKPLLLAPIPLLEQWKRRVPRSHRDMVGDDDPEVSSAAQLGAYDTLVLARRGPVVLLPHAKGAIVALGLAGGAAARDKAVAALSSVKSWQETGNSFESMGGAYAVFQSPDQYLPLDLPGGRYEARTARAKIGGKGAVFVRLERTGARAKSKLDLEFPPQLDDADFTAAEELAWASLPDQVAVVVDARGTWSKPPKVTAKATRAGDGLIVASGYAALAWPVKGGVVVIGSNLGDAPDNVAAMLAIPEERYADTGVMLEVTSGTLRVFDPENESEGTKVKLANGSYRVASVAKFDTAAARLVSVLRVTKVLVAGGYETPRNSRQDARGRQGVEQEFLILAVFFLASLASWRPFFGLRSRGRRDPWHGLRYPRHDSIVVLGAPYFPKRLPLREGRQEQLACLRVRRREWQAPTPDDRESQIATGARIWLTR